MIEEECETVIVPPGGKWRRYSRESWNVDIMDKEEDKEARDMDMTMSEMDMSMTEEE